MPPGNCTCRVFKTKIMQYEYIGPDGFERHNCNATRDGDWFIFKCTTCGYHREWNHKTKEMNIVNSGDENALHSGRYEPPAVQMDKICLN